MPRELEEVALILQKVDLNLLQLEPLQVLDANGKPITVQACTNPINWELFDPRTKRAASLKLMVVDNSEQRVTIRQAVQARAQLQEREMNKGLASLRREIFPSVEAAQAALNLRRGRIVAIFLVFSGLQTQPAKRSLVAQSMIEKQRSLLKRYHGCT